jgi:hypothetical protein
VKLGFVASVQFDRPGRAAYAVRALAARDHVVVDQRLGARDRTRLADARLDAGVDHIGVLASRHMIAEEACVFAHLPATG